MPLHHWPNPQVSWRSFHNHWIVRLAEHLNELLPSGFQARPTELIVGIEPDVLLLQANDQPDSSSAAKSQRKLAEATLTAILPPPAENPIVGVYSAYDNRRLVAAIEIASPGNKDRPEAVDAFTEKALFLLQEGVHLMIVDVISLPHQPIRKAILKRLEKTELVNEDRLWISSYCSLPHEDPQPHLKVREWAHDLGVGDSLPSLPLFLRADQLWITVDLEIAYNATLRAGRYQPS